MNKEDYTGQLIENKRIQLRDEFDQQKTEYFNNLIKEKDKEIERLNNIINKIEKDLEDIFYGRGQHFMDSSVVPIKYVLNKIKALKKGDDNE